MRVDSKHSLPAQFLHLQMTVKHVDGIAVYHVALLLGHSLGQSLVHILGYKPLGGTIA